MNAISHKPEMIARRIAQVIEDRGEKSLFDASDRTKGYAQAIYLESVDHQTEVTFSSFELNEALSNGQTVEQFINAAFYAEVERKIEDLVNDELEILRRNKARDDADEAETDRLMMGRVA